MNLRDLGYLVAVAEERHFGRAADACFVSQPTLSTQIKKLEKELGVELIERNPGQVMLTDAGERVVERARIILGETENIRSIARQAQDPESGSLRLGLFPTIAPYLLPHIVPQLHQRFPNLELLLVEEKTEVVLERLRDGELDAVIIALPVPEVHLHEEFLFSEDFVLAVPSDHPLASTPEPVDVSVLANENVLLLEEGHCLRDQALAYCANARPDSAMGLGATSLTTVMQMVANGYGVTLVPQVAIDVEVRDERVRLLRFAPTQPGRTVGLAWRHTSPRKADFIALGQLVTETLGVEAEDQRRAHGP
jgi:LysR family hydrogen peroxide-inducible transcriptional activator